jgi:hypothetical protein
VGPIPGLDFLEKKKYLGFAGIRTPDRPARSLVTLLSRPGLNSYSSPPVKTAALIESF